MTAWLIIPQMAARIRNTVLASLLVVLITAACDSPTAEQYFDEASDFWYTGEFQKAIVSATKAIRLDPQNASTYFDRGIAHYELGQQDKQDADLKRACELDSQYCD